MAFLMPIGYQEVSIDWLTATLKYDITEVASTLSQSKDHDEVRDSLLRTLITTE